MQPTVTQTSSTSSPSNPDINPTISTLLKGVQSEYGKGAPVFGQQLYTGLSGTTNNALTNTLGASSNSDYSTGVNNAIGQTANIAGGAYLNGGNPYFEAGLSKTLNDTASGINASLGGSGRLGSNLQVQSLAEGLGNVSNSSRQQNYENEYSRMMQAQQQLPGLYQASLLPGATQLQVGQMRDADALAQRQAEYELWSRQNNAGWDSLSKASAILGGTAPYGGTTQTQQTPGASPFQQIAGAGIGLGSIFL